MDLWQERVEKATATIRQSSTTPVEGCSIEEVLQFQQDLGFQIPAAYTHYLLAVGKDCGDFLTGSDRLFTELDSIHQSALALLSDDCGPTLPDGAFVFCSHQGYQFLFLRAGTDDPPVEYYLEGGVGFRIVSTSFSEWLRDSVATEYG